MRKLKYILPAVALLAASGLTHAQSALVAYDGQTGAVSFTPSVAVTPVITGVVAAITAGLALFVAVVGIRWIYRTLKGSK